MNLDQQIESQAFTELTAKEMAALNSKMDRLHEDFRELKAFVVERMGGSYVTGSRQWWERRDSD